MSDTATTPASTIPMDRLVKAYQKIRTAIQEKTQAYEAEVAVLEDQKKSIATAMLEQMKGLGVSSMRTDYGVAYITKKIRYTAQDWGAFKEFVIEHQAIDLLEKRIAQKNLETWVEEHPGAFPPGVGADASMDVVVRKN